MRPNGAMHLKKRRRRRLYRLLLVLLALGLAAWLKWQYLPTVRALVTMQVDDETSDLICQAVSETLEAQALSYADLVRLSLDQQGRVIALQTDLIRAGRFRHWLPPMPQDHAGRPAPSRRDPPERESAHRARCAPGRRRSAGIFRQAFSYRFNFLRARLTWTRMLRGVRPVAAAISS